jgi:DNA-directed RNA polymerase subunit delta
MAVSVYNFDEEYVKELATIELAYQIFKETKSPFYFNQLAEEIKKIKQINNDKLYDVLPQLYTELNLDGRFLHLGKNEWALKSWYSVATADELLRVREIDEDEEDIVELLDEEPSIVTKGKMHKDYELDSDIDNDDDIDLDAIDEDAVDLADDDDLDANIDEDLDADLDEELDDLTDEDLGYEADEEEIAADDAYFNDEKMDEE